MFTSDLICTVDIITSTWGEYVKAPPVDSKKDDLELCAEKFVYVFMCRQKNSGQNHNIKMANNYFKMWLISNA